MYPPSSAWRVAAVDCPRVQAAAFSGARDLMNCASGRRAHLSWAPDGYQQLGSGDAAPGVAEVGDDFQFPAERADVVVTAAPVADAIYRASALPVRGRFASWSARSWSRTRCANVAVGSFPGRALGAAGSR